MKRFLAVAALLLVPTSAADQSFSASSIDVTWSSADAVPRAISFHGDGSFSLEAQAVHAETDRLRMAETGAAAGVVTQPPETTRANYGPSTWQAQATASPRVLFIIPNNAEISVTQGQGTAFVPLLSCASQPNYFDAPRPLACPSVQDSLHLKALATQWVIRGNFTLIMWSWEGTLTEGVAETPFWTGSRPTSTNGAGFGEFEYRQTYLDVTEGILALGPKTGESLDLYALRFNARVERAAIHAGEGIVSGAVPAQSLLVLGRTGSSIDARVEGPATAAVGIASLAQGWMLGAMGALVLVGPAGMVLVRRNKGLTHLGLASDNLELENHRAAARHADKASKIRALRSRAGLLGAVACIRIEDLQGAEQFIAKMHGSPGHDEAGCRFLLAHVRVQQGRADEGQALLEECLSINPSYMAEAAGSSVLAPFLDPSKWPRSA